MQMKNFFPVFLVLFIFSVFLFFLARSGNLAGLTGFLEQATLPLQKFTFSIFHKPDNSENAKLRQENIELTAQLVDHIREKRENQALRDQFQTTYPVSNALLPAKIVGMIQDQIILDKGNKDGVRQGLVVVSKNNLVGIIVKTGTNISVLDIITRNAKLTSKTLKTFSPGIIKTSGGQLILDNVLLSDKLEKGEFVVTKGDVNSEGNGFPPDLVIGKIVSINKKASSLFQSASVKSLVDFSRLEMVFVVMNYE